MKLYPEGSVAAFLCCSLVLSAAALACHPVEAQGALRAPGQPKLQLMVEAGLVEGLVSSPGENAAVEDGSMLAVSSSAAEAVSFAAEAGSGLPEAPGRVARPQGSADGGLASQADARTRPAPKYATVITPTETAQRLSGGDKTVLALRELYSPINLLAMVSSAGYEQALNSDPNYGTDRGAFGQRLGAAAIRECTQSLFGDGLLAPMMHMDTRYYIAGPKYSVGHRTRYAVSRLFVSRTDSGRRTLNAPLLLGYAASSALTPLYYPQINRNFGDVASGYGGSLGGAVIGFLVDEFAGPLVKAVHLAGKQ